MSDPKNVVFTKHAMKRARERHLWKYVNKMKFFFDSEVFGINKARCGECVYVYNYVGEKAIIITMHHV
jgi:hypothetical protein